MYWLLTAKVRLRPYGLTSVAATDLLRGTGHDMEMQRTTTFKKFAAFRDRYDCNPVPFALPINP